MQQLHIAALIAALFAGPILAQDEEPPIPKESAWRDLTGEAMPELPGVQWLSGEGGRRSTAELRGRVWMLAVLSPRLLPSRDAAIALIEFHQQHAAEGFDVIVLSVDDAKETKAELIDRLEAHFPIGLLEIDERVAPFVQQAGTFDTPRFTLVGSDGKVVSHAMPTPEQIASLLSSVWIPEIDHDLHASLADARSAYDAGWSGVARELAAKFAKEKDEALLADAQYLITKCERHGVAAVRDALEERKNELPEFTYGRLLEVSRQFEGLEAIKLLTPRLKALEKNPRVTYEGKVWSAYEKELDHELAARRLSGKRMEAELDRVAKALEKITDKERRGTAPQFMRKRIDALRGTK